MLCGSHSHVHNDANTHWEKCIACAWGHTKCVYCGGFTARREGIHRECEPAAMAEYLESQNPRS